MFIIVLVGVKGMIVTIIYFSSAIKDLSRATSLSAGAVSKREFKSMPAN